MFLYEKIEQAIRQHEIILHVDDNLQESEIRHSIRWVMRDNPDIFWFVHRYYFDQEGKTISFRYQFSKERREFLQKSIDDVVENDFQVEHVRTLDIFEQVMYVYKWLLMYCNYNVNSAYNQNIDSVFVRRNSVCTGYAKAAQYLFNLLGIESRLVFGKLNDVNDGGRHCWNIICIEGIYYHFDVCVGDLSLEDLLVKAGAIDVLRYGDFNYNCFCISTEEIAKTRTIEDVETLPICRKCLGGERLEALSRITIKQRNNTVGCLLSHIGSSADIYLCSKDKNVVLKMFRDNGNEKCCEEYGYMDGLGGCEHLVQLNYAYTDIDNNIIAIEQYTPIVDLFCSHYYHPTLQGLFLMVRDITKGWQECYERGILYRDIHVCNIYKSNSGVYKLGDFGSCTHQIRGVHDRVGSPWFMSPETYINGHFDERSAVYSITAVLYFILNGLRPPFVNGNNDSDALRKKMSGEPLPTPAILHTIPKNMSDLIMDRIIIRGCAYYPSERIRSTEALLMEIIHLMNKIKGQNIDIQFDQPCSEMILNDSAADIVISCDVHRWGTYSENVEQMACTSYEDTFECSSHTIRSKKAKKTPLNSILFFPLAIIGQGISAVRGIVNEIVADPDTIADAIDDMTDHCDDSVLLSVILPVASSIIRETQFDAEKKSLDESKSNKRTGKRKSFFEKRNKKSTAFSSIFAPAEIKKEFNMQVQVFLHLFDDAEKVKMLAHESDKKTERRDFIPLQCEIKEGDKVDVFLTIYGNALLMSEKKDVIWQKPFTKCSFDYFVPNDIDVDELSCVALLSVNGIPIGEMRFITKIVENPRRLNPEIVAHQYRKVFVSYSHKDEPKVKFLHKGLELGGVPHFFDRKYLKAGDVFPQIIQDYINSADLFVLCWSENAAKSEYVEKERKQALGRAFPQVKPQDAAKLSIYPMSIEPRAELPDDMKDNYHFGEL